MLILKYIEQKNTSNQNLEMSKMSKNTLPSVKGASTSRHNDSIITVGETSIYDLDKKKYGALLPKTGVYFLPDDRVVAFLKVMDFVRKREEAHGNYMMANKFKKIFDRWSQDEQHRQ